jgi:hypothetical protein
VAVTATICSCNDYDEIVEWGKSPLAFPWEFSDVDKGHGRIETRRCIVTPQER